MNKQQTHRKGERHCTNNKKAQIEKLHKQKKKRMTKIDIFPRSDFR